jgi:hypothetical protein
MISGDCKGRDILIVDVRPHRATLRLAETAVTAKPMNEQSWEKGVSVYAL